jgi:hypothetical protein
MRFKPQMLKDDFKVIQGTLTTEEWNAEQTWSTTFAPQGEERLDGSGQSTNLSICEQAT